MKRLVMAVCGVSMLLMFSSVSFAESGYCTNVQVVQAGARVTAGTGENVVLLKNTRSDCDNWAKDSVWWFYLDGQNADAMLASALTAKSLGTPVTIVPKVASTYSNWGTLIQVSVQ